MALGGLLALYDAAEVVLKPVFGALSDRVGAKAVLLGGLIGFALATEVFSVSNEPGPLWAARLGQGAAASAFSPAASALVARLNPKAKQGRAFGSYGFYKSIGYTAGPLLGGALAAAGGLRLVFVVMSVPAGAVAVCAALAVPHVPPIAKSRQTLLDLARRLADGAFLRPTLALAFATGALSIGVGFLPVLGWHAGLGTVTTGAAVSLLALCAALTQPRAGRALDAGRLDTGTGVAAGLAITAVGLAAGMIPGLAGMLIAAVLIGVGTGVITPLGFAALASATPPERIGATLGAAELGRELCDAGGPLLVGAVAVGAGLAAGFGTLAALTALAAPLTRASCRAASSRCAAAGRACAWPRRRGRHCSLSRHGLLRGHPDRGRRQVECVRILRFIGPLQPRHPAQPSPCHSRDLRSQSSPVARPVARSDGDSVAAANGASGRLAVLLEFTNIGTRSGMVHGRQGSDDARGLPGTCHAGYGAASSVVTKARRLLLVICPVTVCTDAARAPGLTREKLSRWMPVTRGLGTPPRQPMGGCLAAQSNGPRDDGRGCGMRVAGTGSGRRQCRVLQHLHDRRHARRRQRWLVHDR
nr:MFS transporter [Actinospica robiniae]